MIDSGYRVFRRTGDEISHDAHVLHDGLLWHIQEPFTSPTEVRLARRAPWDVDGRMTATAGVSASILDLEIIHIASGKTTAELAPVEQHEHGNNVPIIAKVEHPDGTSTMELAYIGLVPVIVFSYTDALAQVLEFKSEQQAQEHYRTVANSWQYGGN